MRQIGRRELLKIGGIGVMGLVLPGWQRRRPTAPADAAAVIQVGNNYIGGQWFFDPAGVYIQKGQKVFWTSSKWGATVTAFHPSNSNHELRIPENAKPFDSGIIGDSYKNTFEWQFDVEGTYDYFSRNHESMGMVGRIVVGAPGGPAEKCPPGYGDKEGRALVFPDEIKVLNALSSQEIVAKKRLALPKNFIFRAWPYSDR
ncbi:MAG: hypothetical protein HYX72_01210 [Acidobacteria bacterium]|nr:hypothetical protein [Acidobacteriota bacterium]